METRYIEINKKDINDYFLTLSDRCLIRKIRTEIFRTMPDLLKKEYKSLINELECIDDKNGLYKFVAISASDKLTHYLDQFIFILKPKKDAN